MSKASVEEQLASLQALRVASVSLDQQAAAARLRPFLQQPNHLVVARAADLARELECHPALDDLIAAFRRFLEGPEKKDPQCWAKNALSKAMHQLGCDDARLYLAGLRLHQYEPVWGGQSDVAGTLRANCAHALIDCHQLSHHALLLHLLEVVTDDDKSVRAEALRAIAQAGGESAMLLLRLRALTAGEEDPSVIGHCYAGLLSLEGVAAVPFVAKFLRKQDDFSAEAAVALGETRTPEALAALLACLRPSSEARDVSPRVPRVRAYPGKDAFLEPWFATVLLSAIALTRQPEAVDSLLTLISEESSHAEAAIEALASAGYGKDTLDRLATIVHCLDNARITRTYKQHFPG
jgi:HEAT repeat protein